MGRVFKRTRRTAILVAAAVEQAASAVPGTAAVAFAAGRHHAGDFLLHLDRHHARAHHLFLDRHAHEYLARRFIGHLTRDVDDALLLPGFGNALVARDLHRFLLLDRFAHGDHDLLLDRLANSLEALYGHSLGDEVGHVA